MRTKKTAFDRYFGKRMKEARFAADYRAARAEIDATDALVRALDEAREAGSISKAELARRIGAKPEAMRRLLTAPRGNPTIATVLKVASALGYHLELVPDAARRGRRSDSRNVAARKVSTG